MKIGEIKDGMNGVEFEGEVVEKAEPRDVMTKFGNNRVTTVKVKDDTGTVSLTLWGKQIDLLNVGDKVAVKGGYTRSFKDEVQVSVGKSGSIQKV